LKIKVIYIISNINKALAFEWIASLIDKERIDLKFILLGQKNTELSQFLSNNKTPYVEINYQSKKDIIRAFFSTYKYLSKENPQVVHAHFFEASIIGLTAAKLLSIRRRIYTRHHATIHHDYFPMAVWYDKYINLLATDIVAISDILKEILIEKEGVNDSKIHLIPHGFMLDLFEDVLSQRINAVRDKYNIPKTAPIIGVIARHTIWKGIQYIIPAFQKISLKFPNAHLILANARGSYEMEIRLLLSKIPDNCYTEIIFEEDIAALYKLFDVYVHTPIDPYAEAFGQTYVEVLASGIPSIFTLSGIAQEFIKDRDNALIVPYKDSQSIYKAMVELMENNPLRLKLIENGKKSVGKFNLMNFIQKLEDLYLG